MVNYKTLLRLLGHVVFCFVIIVFFGNFCTLRTAACQHLYKEYLSGVSVLFIVYLNFLFLFPRYYKRRLFLKYTFGVGLSVVIAFLLEMLLVAPDIIDSLDTHREFSPLLIILGDGFYVLLRDISFATVTFSFLAMSYYKQKTEDNEVVLLHEFNMIEVMGRGKEASSVRVNLSAIAYFRQFENATHIKLVDGQEMLRNGTLKKIAKLICNQYGVQISRNTIVPYKSIRSYNQSKVIVKSTPQDEELPFTASYQQEACKLIVQNTGKTESKTISKDVCPKTKQKQADETYSYQRKQQKTLIFEYINTHPGCSASDIKKNRSISLSTVNRILKQLKEEGLVEYVGSKKTGGYRAVDKQPDGINTEENGTV